jgi:hypothetical protein
MPDVPHGSHGVAEGKTGSPGYSAPGLPGYHDSSPWLPYQRNVTPRAGPFKFMSLIFSPDAS